MSFQDLDLRGFYSASDDALGHFYVPVLKEATAYDRVTGYYRSSSLVVAAAGISRFLANDGRMRIIAGAELAEEDYRALDEGLSLEEVVGRRLLHDPVAGEDIVARRRLETLGYLVKHRRLEIKIGVPLDNAGRPLRRDESNRYFHTKFGLLSDRDGNRVAFIGSDNESAAGWRDNHESFTVAKSWMAEVWSEHGAPITERFATLWNGAPDTKWAVLPLPEAVAKHLIALAKPEPPPPTDLAEDLDPGSVALVDIRLQYVAAAPRIGGGTEVGFATAGVMPWPHQEAIARRAVDSYPRSYLLADEVGLGKTIEIGLIIRELLVSDKAERILLLVPASILKQWQEELAEKFALRVPRLDRETFFDVDDQEVEGSPGNPWRSFPVLLASSHLARRRSRRDEVLAAGPWDVVFVDEAHHAGRAGSKAKGTPNTLLRLLQDMKARDSWRALYLASATPMQMHAHEAWDLLELLGLPGRWGEDAGPFVHYYEELREGFLDREWPFLRKMSADHFSDPQVQPAEEVEHQVRRDLGLAGSWFVREFAKQGLSSEAAGELDAEQRAWLDEWLRANTPMRERVFRTTRGLLRRYVLEGVLPIGTTIPIRRVADHFIPMRPDEAALYERIETYIAHYYDAYMSGDKAQRPLGFIMTVYRRRLTSSFLAIELSLRRRLRALLQDGQAADLLTHDDVAALEGSTAFDPDIFDGPTVRLANEVAELKAFIKELEKRPPVESKMERLRDELMQAFHSDHDTVVVFTQYTDTLDYLRDQLVGTFGSKLICYSGRGGERWDPELKTWVPVTKKRVKELFREGKDVKILLGTDALSEGLNLQTSAKLINYDMPWNFMRVEQRIGRLDRIGGKPIVEISNYFYEDTVEEQIYRGIGEDVDWFEDVVGPAQPVLNQIEMAIEDVAMEAPSLARQRDVAVKIAQIRSSIEASKAEAIGLKDLERDVNPGPVRPEPAITLAGLQEILTSVPATAGRLLPHPDIKGAYVLNLPDRRIPVTFNRAVLDEYAPDVRLLTYGSAELDELLVLAGVQDVELLKNEFQVDGTPVHNLHDLSKVISRRART